MTNHLSDRLAAELAVCEDAAWGQVEVYDQNEGMSEYGPLWSVANDEFHNPPSDDEAYWGAFHAIIETGVKADAERIALAINRLPLALRALQAVMEKASRMTVYAESTDYWGGVRAAGDEILAALNDKLGVDDER